MRDPALFLPLYLLVVYSFLFLMRHLAPKG